MHIDQLENAVCISANYGNVVLWIPLLRSNIEASVSNLFEWTAPVVPANVPEIFNFSFFGSYEASTRESNPIAFCRSCGFDSYFFDFRHRICGRRDQLKPISAGDFPMKEFTDFAQVSAGQNTSDHKTGWKKLPKTKAGRYKVSCSCCRACSAGNQANFGPIFEGKFPSKRD